MHPVLTSRSVDRSTPPLAAGAAATSTGEAHHESALSDIDDDDIDDDDERPTADQMACAMSLVREYLDEQPVGSLTDDEVAMLWRSYIEVWHALTEHGDPPQEAMTG